MFLLCLCVRVGICCFDVKNEGIKLFNDVLFNNVWFCLLLLKMIVLDLILGVVIILSVKVMFFL